MTGWHANQALRLLPDLWGLPTRFAALLLTVCLMLGVQFGYVKIAVWIAICGVGFGRLMVQSDPFIFEIMAKNVTLPQRMVP